jgi:hypothetical protein
MYIHKSVEYHITIGTLRERRGERREERGGGGGERERDR